MSDGESEAFPQSHRGKQHGSAGLPKVPVVGDSWYDRGVNYWARRIGFVLGMALVILLGGIGGVALYTKFRRFLLPSDLWPVADGVVAVASCAMVLVGFLHARVKLREQRRSPTPTAQLRAKRAEARAQAARWRGPAQLLVYVCAPLLLPLVGYLTGMVAGGMLGREVAAEIAARREWEARQ
jgi:hypothetical protein